VANGGKKVVKNVIENVDNKKEYKCNKCDKIYYNKYSKYKHQKICSNIVKDLIAKIDMMEEEIKNNAKIIKNNTQITKINNGIINHITINKMGDENYLNLSDENIKLIFSKEIESVFTFVELLNFNKDMPRITNNALLILRVKKEAINAYEICSNKLIVSFGKEKYRRYNSQQKLEKINELDKKIPIINFDLYYPKD
jgi:hypothetical protein